PAPNGPVTTSAENGNNARIASTTRCCDASTKSVAPKSRAIGSFATTVSTATMRDAPAIASAWIALRPTPPTPNTTAVSPRCTCAAFHTEPAPVITPQAMRHAEVSGTSSGIGTAWISWITVRSASDDVAAKFEHGSPWNVNGSVRLPIDDRQRVGCPVLHGRHLPQLAIVDTTMWSPG